MIPREEETQEFHSDILKDVKPEVCTIPELGAVPTSDEKSHGKYVLALPGY